jgi:hypothetical protein
MGYQVGKYKYSVKEDFEADLYQAKLIYGNDITVSEFAEYKERQDNQQHIILLQSKMNQMEKS